MRVAVYPADDGGCGNYRLRWPAEMLAASGADVVVGDGLPGVWRQDLISGDRELIGCRPVDADVVVLQRPLQRDLADVIPHLQAQGTAVVVEVDDDFHAIPRANVAWSHVHPKADPLRNFQHLARACAAADLVTVSTPALAARYAKHGRVVVLPNCVPGGYLQIPAVDTPRTVGWSGILDTHPGDLEVTRGAVGRAARRHDLTVRIVGTGEGVAHALGAREVFATGWRPIDEYPHRLAELGVGLVPLAAHAFNEAKSWLKGIEMAAVGVPFIASPTTEYRRLARLGAGRIAERARDWERAIGELATNDDRRREAGERARAVVAAWTIENHAERWLAAWKQALERRAA